MTHFNCSSKTCFFQACLDFQCVNASALLPNLDCDANTTCNSQGVKLHFLFSYRHLGHVRLSLFNVYFRYVMIKGTATVKMAGPHLIVTSQGTVAAQTAVLLRQVELNRPMIIKAGLGQQSPLNSSLESQYFKLLLNNLLLFIKSH